MQAATRGYLAGAVVVLSMLAAVPAAASPHSEAAGCHGVAALPSSIKARDIELEGVAALSACDIWTVGSGQADKAAPREGAVALHWDGKSWHVAAAPSPGGAGGFTQLDAVAIDRPSDAWAVGSYGKSQTSTGHALIERWNGTSWTRVASPGFGTHSVTLAGVTATSPSNAWVVGSYEAGNTVHGLIEHWNGKTWRVQATYHPAGDNDVDITGIAATKAGTWAVGADNEISRGTALVITEHWTGGHWTRVSGTAFRHNAFLDVGAVTVVSRTDAWTVGDYCAAPGCQTVADHWNGRTWTRTVSPSPGPRPKNVVLAGVTAISARNAWAVGSFNDNTTPKILIEHWNGRTWTQVPAREPGGQIWSLLTAIAGHNPRSLVAVGYYMYRATAQPLVIPLH